MVANLPTRMNCVLIKKIGDPSVLELAKVPLPTLQPRDILVKIKAVSVNPVDYKLRTSEAFASVGEYKILGYDGAGVVVKVGSEATKWKVGDEVMFSGSHVRQGTDAEYTAVDERIVGRKPKKFSFEEAAALPLVSLTAWEAFVEKLNVTHPNPTDSKDVQRTLLIINAAGGVGTIATQFATIFNLKVIATASRSETTSWVKSHGAHHIISHREPLKPQLEKLGIQPDYILLCYNTSAYIEQTVDITAPLGRICSIVETEKDLPFINLAMAKALAFSWEFMFAKPLFGVALESQGEYLNTIADFADEGKIKSIVSEVKDLTLANLRQVHETVENGKAVGKIALRVVDKWE